MSKAHVVALTATSDYDTAGKQHIGRVTGPDPKWGLALAFVGTKSGKRGGATTAKVTGPGLYKIRSTTRKGISDAYVLVWDDPDTGLTEEPISEDRAVEIASGDLSTTAINAAGRRAAIEWQENKLEESADEADTDMVTLQDGLLTLAAGGYTRAEIRAVRRAEIARLRGETSSSRAKLEDERRTLLARLAEIETMLAGQP